MGVPGGSGGEGKMANELPCSQKMFRLELADWLPVWYGAHLRRLRHLMERLGQDIL